jgi:putative glutathione S-transferase
MTDASDAAYASDVDYETYGRHVGAKKLDEALKAGAGSPYAAYRSLSAFRGRIDVNGATPFDASAGRYHLYLAAGCPFCHRLLIVLRLLGLESVVSLSFVDDERDGRGWAFRARRGPDPVNNFRLLAEAYRAADPNFDGHVSVPVLWDRETRRIVSNDSGDILLDLATQFSRFTSIVLDLYPEPLRAEIDAFDSQLEAELAFGVYLAGMAKNEREHTSRVRRIFDRLDDLDARLRESRFLFGDGLTVSDIRLFVTLARFDVAYYPVFRVDLKRVVDFPDLWAYARDLYRIPAFCDFTDFERYRNDYIRNFPSSSPRAATPAADWTRDPQRGEPARAVSLAGE